MSDETTQVFETHRARLRALAYRMLGSAADADDIVQEAYVRWQGAPMAEVDAPRAYLTRIVSRLCLDQLRSARHRREHAVGAWLPEPIDAETRRDPAELSSSLSMAFMVLLQQLSPTERAAFLLREVFDYDYAEVSSAVGKSEANCRQIVRRAREHLATGAPRFDAASDALQPIVARFGAACGGGDLTALLELLAPDVTLYADGGPERAEFGKARAVRKPLSGAATVGQFLVAVGNQGPERVTREHLINGQPSLLSYVDGALVAVFAFEIAEGRVQAIFLNADPAKLASLGPLRFLA